MSRLRRADTIARMKDVSKTGKVVRRTQRFIAQYDTFGESPSLSLSGGISKIGTVMGTIVTALLISALVWYGYEKMEIMMKYDDTNIMISKREWMYNDTQILSDKFNFNIAFGITEYDGSPESVEDPDIGTVKAYYR